MAEEYSSYCPDCGHCGFIDCDGVESFLEQHVRGKTTCQYEDMVIEEIKLLFEETRQQI